MKKSTLIILGLSSLITGCAANYKFQPDSVGEEILEEGAKAAGKAFLNVDIPDFDLSPGTPEKGFSPKSILPFKKEDVKN